MSKYEIYEDEAGEWRWRLKAANSKIVASGEGYKTQGGAIRGVDANRRAAIRAKVVTVKGKPKA